MRYIWFFLFISLLPGMICPVLGESENPFADPKAIVKSDNARFTILTPELIRLEWIRDGVFEDRASLVFINRFLPVPLFSVNTESGWLTITTEKLTLRYRQGSGKFSADNLSISFILNGDDIKWYPGLADSLNLKGTTRTLDGTNGEKDVKLEDGIISRSGWAVVDDSQSLLFDGSDWNWAIPRPLKENIDWYFFGYGHNYKKALFDFTRVAGKIPMPPQFTFGYWWSRYWTYSDDELRKLIKEMRSYDVPIDVLVIDMDWHETHGLSTWNTKRDPFGQAVGWTGYTWNRSLFPDPERFIKWTDAQNLKTALNLHPASGIAPMEEQYAGFTRAYGFDTTGRQYIPFAIEEKKWAETYFNVLLRPFEKQGIDFWWLDWQAWLENKNLRGLSNTWWLNYAFFTDMERQGKARPLLFHRWGGLGNHRYQIGFSGDTYITWESLSYLPYFTATASNVGYGYWSHDIGGHMGGEPTSELFLRWLQYGIFSPILRTHATKSAGIERRVWKHGDYFESMRDAIHLRYALVPYIYTASRKAYNTGVSLCRPMYYDYPEREEAYIFRGQYMFGDDILVSPVTEKVSEITGLAEKRIWLPEGEWYEYFSGSTLKGNKVIDRNYNLQEIPVFIKSGSIIPMYPRRMNLQQKIDTLLLTIIPGGDGETEIYEDDGTTSVYKSNQFAVTKVSKKVNRSGEARLVIHPRAGNYPNMPDSRAYDVILPLSYPPISINVNNQEYRFSSEPKYGAWWYDGMQLTAHVLVPKHPCGKSIELVIRWSEEQVKSGDLLDGKAGFFRRLPKVMEMIKDENNRRDPIANAPPLVLSAGSLPARISYTPEKTQEYLEEFDLSYMEMLGQIMDIPRGDISVLENILHQLPEISRILPAPVITLEKPAADHPVKVQISSPDPSAAIYYTLDGSFPTEQSVRYDGPFDVARTVQISARAFRPGYLQSFKSTQFFQYVYADTVEFTYPYSPRYTGGGSLALVNGRFGVPEDYRSDWVGFQQTDLVATIHLKKPRSLSSITARFLQSQDVWIFLPAHVQFEVASADGEFHTVFEQNLKTEAESQSGESRVKSVTGSFNSKNITQIRVTAKNIGSCPSWHGGAGGKAWIFSDEIIIE